MANSAEAAVLSNPAEKSQLTSNDTSRLNTVDIIGADSSHNTADTAASKEDQSFSDRLLGKLQIIDNDVDQGISVVKNTTSAALHQGKLFAEGVTTGAVLNPINGTTELINHTVGTHIGQLQFDNQSEVDNSTAGKIGKISGTIADFALLSVATGGAADAVGLSGLAATSASLGTAGAIEGGLLTPTGDTNNFFENRALGAVIGGASGALGGASGKVLAGTTAEIENATVQKVVAAAGSIALGSTMAAGTTEAVDYTVKGKVASADELLLSAGLGAVGGMIGAARALSADAVASTADNIGAARANEFALSTGDAAIQKPEDAPLPDGGDNMQSVQLDNSGRPVTDGNAERIAQAHPPLSPEVMGAQKAALQTDMENYKGDSDGKSVAQVLADSPLSSDQQQLVLNVLAETRASFLKAGADGNVSEQQQGNYWHTLGELKEGLESSKANGLSANDTESAALSGILSDSHKIGFSQYSGGGNFFTHHLDGALTADTILSRYNADPEIIGAVRQAVLEHQISPPNFMSRAYAGEIRAGMKAAGMTPSAADEGDIANIQKMIGDPLNSPSVADSSGIKKLDFTASEQNLLKTYAGDGTQNWYIPNSRPGMVGIAADVFDNYLPETAADGTPIKGPFKIAGLRGPSENPPDLSLASAISGIKDNMQQSIGLLTETDQARAVARIGQADGVYAQAKEATSQWLKSSLGITADAKTPYLNEPLTPPAANANADQIAAWKKSPDVQLGIQIQKNFAEQLLAMRMRSS